MQVGHPPKRKHREQDNAEPAVEIAAIDAGNKKGDDRQRPARPGVTGGELAELLAIEEDERRAEEQKGHDQRKRLVGGDEQQERADSASGQRDCGIEHQGSPRKAADLFSEAEGAAEIARKDGNRARRVGDDRRNPCKDKGGKGEEGSPARDRIQNSGAKGGEHNKHYVEKRHLFTCGIPEKAGDRRRYGVSGYLWFSPFNPACHCFFSSPAKGWRVSEVLTQQVGGGSAPARGAARRCCRERSGSRSRSRSAADW